MIKPEDIPPGLQDKCFLHARGEGPSQRWSIAEILNAAIEAGVVSPPCSCYGPALRPLLGVTHLFPHKPKHEWQEHWKGQTS